MLIKEFCYLQMFNGQIAKYISSFAVEFQNKYWSNVNVWSCENTEVEMVVKK